MKHTIIFFSLLMSTAHAQDMMWIPNVDTNVTTIKQGNAFVLLNKNNQVFLILLYDPAPAPSQLPAKVLHPTKFINKEDIVKIVLPYLKEGKINKDQITILSHIYSNTKANIDAVNNGMTSPLTKRQAQDVAINYTRENFSRYLQEWKPILNQIGTLLGNIDSKIISSKELSECYGDISTGLNECLN